jgi:hypothetical protein
MTDSSRIKKTLKASHVVKIWFWDGEREYEGEAVDLSPERATALLKMAQFGNATVIPTKKVMDGLIKHLSQKTVEWKCTSGIMESAVKAKITLVQPDFENPRRLLLEAEFQPPSEQNRKILLRMAEILKQAGPAP